MNRIAAEIAVEISVFFQHRDRHPGTSEQIASHHPGWSATYDDAASLQFFRRAHVRGFDFNIYRVPLIKS
jgi:hypothetical protein